MRRRRRRTGGKGENIQNAAPQVPCAGDSIRGSGGCHVPTHPPPQPGFRGPCTRVPTTPPVTIVQLKLVWLYLFWFSWVGLLSWVDPLGSFCFGVLCL
eukprot:gene21120-biopygen20641